MIKKDYIKIVRVKQMKRQGEKSEKFKSIEEEAKWWDAHDLGDILDQFEEVKIEVMKKPKKPSLFEWARGILKDSKEQATRN